MQRKLIDLRPSVLDIISQKARKRSMSCKKYIESLVEEDARACDTEILMPDDVSDPVLLGLVGIAKKSCASEILKDDRLDYILSKM